MTYSVADSTQIRFNTIRKEQGVIAPATPIFAKQIERVMAKEIEKTVNSLRCSRQIPSTEFYTIRFLLILALSLGCNFAIAAQAPQNQVTASQQQSDESLAERQERLKNTFTRLEQKLLDLYEFELGENPERSELLKDAFQLSQDRRIALKLEGIVEKLKDEDYKPALDRQQVALEELKALLQLLQNEDQSKRLQEEQKRIKAYLVKVDRLLRIQQGLRGQAEGGVEPQRLSNSQGKTADRAQQLAQELRDDERRSQSIDADDLTQESSPNEGTDGEPSEIPNPDQSNSSEQQPSNQNPMPGQSSDQPPQPSEQSGEPGQGSPEAPSTESPVRQRVEEAQKRMREAQQRLQQAQKDQSIEAMRAAEVELAKAKEELEQILRQLREKEIERTLGMLETRFRELLKREQEIVDRTQRLDQINPTQRGAEFHIETGKLSTTQMSVALETDRLLMILVEEGSATAFPETVLQVRDDMEEVATRLRDSKVDPLTLSIEEDIVDGLQDILDALVAAQEENKQNQEQSESNPGASPQGQTGEAPLVNQIEELKLIRNLQKRIHQRHERYAKLLGQPEDPVGYTSDPEIQRALDRLSERQSQLQKITRDVIENQ